MKRNGFNARWLETVPDAKLELVRHELAVELKRYPRNLKADQAARSGLMQINRERRLRR